MRLEEIIRPAPGLRADSNDDRASAPDDARRSIAFVIAEPELAAAVSELYQAHGYEVFLPETPLDVVETLLAAGDRVRVVLISSEAGWATGLDELLAEEFPKAERLTLLP